MLHLLNVEVCISEEVLTDWGLGITQSTVKGGATHTDENSNQAKQEEEQAGVPTANIYRETDKESLKRNIHTIQVYWQFAGIHQLF